MPAESKSQKRLMGMVYAYKTGELDISKMPKALQDKIKGMAEGMSKKELKDFIDTPSKNLPDKVNNENVTPGSVPGIGSVRFPGSPGAPEDFSNQESGSGDIPLDDEDDETVDKELKHIKSIKDFFKE